MAPILPAASAVTAYGGNRMGTLARSDRWQPVWAITLAATLLPGLWIAGLAVAGALGARALKQAINLTGDWSIYLLLVTLAVTPAHHLLAAPRLILARRTLGLAACGYAALHLVLYALDLDLDLGRVAGEIVLRLYLTIGAVALLGLAALAATSWDGAVRRLGAARWSRLHRLVHACALLSVVHFLLRSPTTRSSRCCSPACSPGSPVFACCGGTARSGRTGWLHSRSWLPRSRRSPRPPGTRPPPGSTRGGSSPPTSTSATACARPGGC
jgi:DMSO/TMAO reductase YedYZ heme-binding membrane subunit